MRTLRDHWVRFWFAPSDPLDLGLGRLLFFGLLCAFYLPQDFAGGGARWLATLQTVWKLALLGSCVGWFTRTCMSASFLLGLYVLGLPQQFGKTHQFDALIALVLGTLAFSRAGDAWSIDALARAARQPGADQRPPSGAYTWPIRLIWTMMSLVLFASGLSTLHAVGLSRILSDHTATPLMQAVTFAFELGYPLALISVPARWIVVPGMCVTQLGIHAFRQPTFYQFVCCNVFWVPWHRVAAWLTQRLPHKTALTILFDGSCGLCQATVAVVRRLDLLGRVEIRNVLTEWPQIHARFPWLTKAACLEDMHAVTADGRTVVGFEAYRTMAWSLPLGWLLLPLLYLPGARPVGRRVYARIAARRVQAGCPLPPARPAPTPNSLHAPH